MLRFLSKDFLGWLLAGYAAFLPVQYDTGIGFRFAPADLFLLLFLTFGIGWFRFAQINWSFWHLGMLLVFQTGTLVAVLKNGYVSQYALIQKDIGLLALFAAYTVIAAFATDWSRIRWILRVFILSVVFQNIIALGEFFLSQLTGFDITRLNYAQARLSGLLVDPNAYGGLLVLTFTMLVITYYSAKPLLGGPSGLFCLLTLAAGILLTFSRSAWIGLIALFPVILVKNPRHALRLAAIILFAVTGVLFIMGGEYWSTIVSMATRSSPVDARIDIISEALALFADNPVLGIGIGAFAEGHGVIIHNTPVWFLAEFGLFGFIIFTGFALWFIIRGCCAYKLAPPEEKPLILGLVAAHIAMLGLSLGIEALYQRHWWLVMALIASGYQAALKFRQTGCE